MDPNWCLVFFAINPPSQHFIGCQLGFNNSLHFVWGRTFLQAGCFCLDYCYKDIMTNAVLHISKKVVGSSVNKNIHEY